MVNYEKLFKQIAKDIKIRLNTGISFNALCKECNLSTPVMAKLRDQKTTGPNYESLAKLSEGLGFQKSHYINLLQYFDGQTPIDPRSPNKKTDNNVSDPFRFPKEHYKQLPMYKASAGDPLPYVNDYPENWAGDYSWADTEGLNKPFFVAIEGDSMNKESIDSGDYCLVDENPCPQDGEIVLAIKGTDSATVKFFKKTENGIVLDPSSTNPENKTIFIPASETEEWRFYTVIETRHKHRRKLK